MESSNKPVGEFADVCLGRIQDMITLDLTFHISLLMSVRTTTELETQGLASQLACSFMKFKLINQIENVLDSESKQSHASIVSEAMNATNDEKFLERMQRKHNVCYNFYNLICSYAD